MHCVANTASYACQRVPIDVAGPKWACLWSVRERLRVVAHVHEQRFLCVTRQQPRNSSVSYTPKLHVQKKVKEVLCSPTVKHRRGFNEATHAVSHRNNNWESLGKYTFCTPANNMQKEYRRTHNILDESFRPYWFIGMDPGRFSSSHQAWHCQSEAINFTPFRVIWTAYRLLLG